MVYPEIILAQNREMNYTELNVQAVMIDEKGTDVSAFFDIISDRRQYPDLVTAWVISGEDAGKKALFAVRDNRLEPLLCEAALLEEFAAGITGDQAGLAAGVIRQGESRLFVERIAGGRKLIICGAGHVSMPIIRTGRMLGFEITVVEDREEFARRAQEAGANHVLCAPFPKALETIISDGRTAFVVVTRDHSHDMDCLHQILKKEYAYVGMMGSHYRTGLVRWTLLEEGYARQKTDDLHMPIGLAIGARTPEEIAISIMAELIQVMNRTNPGEEYPEGFAEEISRILKSEASDPDERGGCVLAMIVAKDGEAPRKPGTKMLIRQDGSFLGTIGGGFAEAQVVQRAGRMLEGAEEATALMKISMQKGDLQCGGEIEVFLVRLLDRLRDGSVSGQTDKARM